MIIDRDTCIYTYIYFYYTFVFIKSKSNPMQSYPNEEWNGMAEEKIKGGKTIRFKLNLSNLLNLPSIYHLKRTINQEK